MHRNLRHAKPELCKPHRVVALKAEVALELSCEHVAFLVPRPMALARAVASAHGSRSLLVLACALHLTSASIYDLSVDDLQSGLPVEMSYYKDKVLLVVNVASECGYTAASYKHLNELHDRYAERGLAILGFPCNQFGSQEPGGPEQIFDFTQKKGVKFDMFRKVEVNGHNAHPLWKYVRSSMAAGHGASPIMWNFEAFLVDKGGHVQKRFPTGADLTGSTITSLIERLLTAKDEV